MKHIGIGFLLVSAGAWAGTEVTNGGESRVCRDSDTRLQSAQARDLYEYRTRHGKTNPVKIGEAFDSVDDKVEVLLGRLEKRPALLQQYYNFTLLANPKVRSKIAVSAVPGLARAHWGVFYGEAIVGAPSMFPELWQPIHDVTLNFGVSPGEGCKYEPLIERLREGKSEPGLHGADLRYYIDGDLWQELGRDDQAAMIVHELLSRIWVDAGFKVLDYVRPLVGALSADD